MNFSWWRITMFALMGAAGLAFLAWYDPPSGAAAVNRHTGHLEDANATPGGRRLYLASAAIRAARETGNALIALERLEKARYEVANPGALEPVLRTLSAEVKPLREQFLPVEGEFDFDRETAEATEEFFAPVVTRRPRPSDVERAAKRFEPPDKIAALVIASVGGHAGTVPSDMAILVAKSMQSNERPRARLRWLIRAFRSDAPSDDLCLELSKAFLEYGRQDAAFETLEVPVKRGTEHTGVLRLRMEVARWVEEPQAEIDAIEQLLVIEEDDKLLARAVEAHSIDGHPEKAVPHAIRLAERTGDLAYLEQAANLAFTGGDVEKGFELQRRLVAEAEDPRIYREKLAERLLVDMRIDDAIEVYKTLAETHPDGGYDRPLEDLVRRRNRSDDLVVILRRRYRREPSEAVEEEMVRLSAVVGGMDETRDLIEDRLQTREDPEAFFRNLLLYHAAEVRDLEAHCLRMLGVAPLSDEALNYATAAIWEMKEREGMEAVAREMGLRYPENEDARELRIASLDWGRTLPEAAAEAERYSGEYPDDEPLHIAWIQRANWAGDGEMEIRARTKWAGSHPDDHENRRLLADMFDYQKHPAEAAEHWAILIEADGQGSESERRYLDSLRAAENYDEELDYILMRAERDDLTVEERLFLAERFFAGQWLDVALASYATILVEVPDHRLALLRTAQIRLWGNDPEGATPYFERLFEIEGPGNGELPFFLGEAYSATDRRAEAWEMMEIALPLLRTEEELTVPREEMVAKILARTGHLEEAIAIYERLVTQVPDDQNLILDYAVAMIATKRVEDSRRVVDMAKVLDPDSRRILRMDGQVLMMEGRHDEAIESFRKGIDKYGPDAGYYADLGQACFDAGRLRESRDAFANVLKLQPESRYAGWTHRVLTDRLEGTIELGGRTKVVADDESLEGWLAGSFEAFEETTRLSFLAAHGKHTGRSAAVDAGATDVTAAITSLGISLYHRFDREWEGGGGLDLYSGRDDAPAFGGWLGTAWRSRTVNASVTARLGVNEPFTEPSAAAGLGGNQTGGQLDGYWQSPRGDWWTSGTLRYRTLSVDSPETGSITNGQAITGLSAGYWIHNRGPVLRDRLTPRMGPVLDEGTTVASEPPDGEGIRISTWIAYTGIRLLSDKELADVLPLGSAFDYLTISGRAEGCALAGIYYEVEGYAGTDLSDPKMFAGLLAGVAWRPTPGFELRIRGGHGLAFGREDGDTGSTEVRVALTVHW